MHRRYFYHCIRVELCWSISLHWRNFKIRIQIKFFRNCPNWVYRSDLFMLSQIWSKIGFMFSDWWRNEWFIWSSYWQLSILINRQGKLPRGSLRVVNYRNSWIIIRFFHSRDRTCGSLSYCISHSERQPYIWPRISNRRTNAIEPVDICINAHYWHSSWLWNLLGWLFLWRWLSVTYRHGHFWECHRFRWSLRNQ